ncbi:MAG: diacylglycerol/lipid kinase family protein [Anaeroplasmataceae bacterium]
MKVLVCYNPYSSTQKIGKNKELVKKRLSKKFDTVDFYESESPRSITKKIIEDGDKYDTILTSGGDGTLNETVTGVIEGGIKTPIAYIPSGTVNDVKSILHLTKRIKKGIDIAIDGIPAQIDICKLQDRYFVYVCAAGKFTSVSYDIDYKLKKRWGRFAYFIRGAQELPKEAGIRVKITTPNEVTYSDCYVFFGFNSQRFGGFKFYRKNKPLLDDGLMDFTFIEKTKFGSFSRLSKFVLFGDKAKNGVRTFTCNKISLETHKDVSYNVDGELAYTGKTCEIEVLHKAVSIIVPRKYYKKMFNKKSL